MLCPSIKPNTSLFGERGNYDYENEGFLMPDFPEEALKSSTFFTFDNLWKLQVDIMEAIKAFLGHSPSLLGLINISFDESKVSDVFHEVQHVW